MEFIIVTGMSGAGKTQAVNALEDIGYFCVDNIPPRLITKFAELPSDSDGHISKIALVVDVRSHKLFSEYTRCLGDLSAQKFPFKVLFLDCDNQSLLHRYKETRRRHPLQDEETPGIEQAIIKERMLLGSARDGASYVLDTSRLSTAQLRGRVRELFLQGIHMAMVVNVNSFGFKRGIPTDSDLLFDVRCLPNPFYEEDLRELSGLDGPVRDYVLGCRQCEGLLPRLTDLIDYLIPLYTLEGKSQLVVSIGCTGGRHRSVAVSEYLAAHLSSKSISVTVNHRDITRTGAE